MRIVKGFLAGALAVPLGHQVVLWILHAIAFTDRAPFAMAATRPFGVPQWISLAFWGGVWGIVLALVLRRVKWYWVTAIVFGAIAPTLVAAFVVAPLKGQPAGGNAKMAVVGLLVNAAWGLVTAALLKMVDRSTIDR